MNQQEKGFINRLITKVFETKKTQFKKAELEGVDILVKLKILKHLQEVPDLLELETNSFLFNQSLYDLAEGRIGKKFPNDISRSFAMVDGLEEILKKENDIKPNVIGSYSAILKGLKGYILFQLEKNGVDIADFYKRIIGPSQKHENHLFLFDDCFFRFLPHSGYDAEKILGICDEVLDKGDSHYVLSFARELCANNLHLAKNLYFVSSKMKSLRHPVFLTNLAVGLFNNGHTGIFSEFEKIVETNPEEGYRFFSAIEINTKKVLYKVYRLVEKESAEAAYQRRTNILGNIIESPLTSKTMRAKCFKKINSFFACKSDDVAHAVIWSVEFIKGYEENKYKLLISYLNRTSNFKILDNFFFRFQNPSYLFRLIKSCYYTKWGRNSIKFFENAILHFWSQNLKETQNEILAMFDPRFRLGLLPVEIIMCGHGHPLPIDLQLLDSKNKQLKAVECFCLYPHSINELIPILIKLRESPFPEVVTYLKDELAQLVFDSYNTMLYKSITDLLSTSKEDKQFLAPIKKALDVYNEVKKMKSAVHDVNPHENEKELMNLYYSLEHEQRAKMMDSIGKGEGSFFGFAKNTVIVRGNSWKIQGREEVMPLGTVKSEHWLDARAYRNPDLFEMNLKKFDS
ncbi:hypothetical protein [Cytophaga sp. FL35]|uniref:hypothetical protein n=1 Tax=Cytophaga sp. FL35 TaxID=1904456 RepID=UPI0016537792|nr:hypothetical protein [Cytophaga sp. FL35]MBC7000376.1 hypothetical protein [Cytophaga sp. FL35]